MPTNAAKKSVLDQLMPCVVLHVGHVFYLATNDAKTKHSAHSQINLTPVDDQQGVG